MKVSNSQKRLSEMMSILGISQTDIVERTGVTKSALSHWVNGKREPRQDQLAKLSVPYNINPAWLMGYDVPMYNAKLPEDTFIDVALMSEPNKDNSSEIHKRIAKYATLFASLSKENQEKIQRAMEIMKILEKDSTKQVDSNLDFEVRNGNTEETT